MHAKRINSLSSAVKGTIESGKLAIHAIGSGLATCNSITRKHAIKQVDRLLSNPAIRMDNIFSDLIPFIIAERTNIVVSMDWTEFDKDDQSVIVLSLQTNHGRNTPLVWKTVRKSLLKGKRTGYEQEVLTILKQNLPNSVTDILIVADRGFGNVVMCEFIDFELGFDYLLRFKANIKLGKSGAEQKPSSNYLTPSGRTKTLTDMEMTSKRYPVAKVYCCKKKDMKDAWFLVSNRRNLSAATALKYYAKRWGIECGFRDIKDYRFGMGMREVRMKNCQKRDRLFCRVGLYY